MKQLAVFFLSLAMIAAFASPMLASEHDAEPECRVYLTAQNTQEFFAELGEVNAALVSCPVKLPGTLAWVAGGNTIITIAMDDGTSSIVSITVDDGFITSAGTNGSLSCTQKITVREEIFNSVLASEVRADGIKAAYDADELTIEGCTLMKKMTFAVVVPFLSWFN